MRVDEKVDSEECAAVNQVVGEGEVAVADLEEVEEEAVVDLVEVEEVLHRKEGVREEVEDLAEGLVVVVVHQQKHRDLGCNHRAVVVVVEGKD